MSTEPNKIIVHLGPKSWNATWTGPHAKRIGELFDTCTLPLPFTASARIADVLREISANHPGVHVEHVSGLTTMRHVS